MPASVLWLRRDLRLADHPALRQALEDGGDDGVVPLFVLDDRLWGPAGDARRAFLVDALHDLDERLGGALTVVHGDPVTAVPRLARSVGAAAVHVSGDAGPYGTRRDAAVARALRDDGRDLVATGCPYAVAPGRVRKGDGTPYRVFTPFARAWREVGWPAPAAPPHSPRWVPGPGATSAIPPRPRVDAALPAASEEAARAAWRSFRDGPLADYATDRNRPDLQGTSRLSPWLRWGHLHPRTLLADLAEHAGKGADTFRSELAWREFYADVLFHDPASARQWWDRSWQGMAVDTDDALLRRWCEGTTGFPFVDAGMRQLLGQGWVHNRVRMVVASFLIKDLHLDWRFGARHFMQHLVDGDLASNQHGWQWVAGSGTDASPWHRVFNPVTQGMRFDPAGDYVRRWVPELRAVAGPAVHEPWRLAEPVAGYPSPLVDHAAERVEALARRQQLRSG